jgi:hypothetical protein
VRGDTAALWPRVGEHLLPWLQKWVFPEEIEFDNRAYAREAADLLFDLTMVSDDRAIE